MITSAGLSNFRRPLLKKRKGTLTTIELQN
jgi:hypothetical protein